jgi:hypothetical protein
MLSAPIEWIEIRWPAPSNRTDRITDVPVDRYIAVIEGKGIKEAP